MKKLLAALVLVSIFAFAPAKKAKKKIGKFVLIEAPEIQADSTIQQLEDFYIFNTEVTNLDYAEFLADLKKNNPEAYKIALYDSLQWNRNGINYSETYVQNYHNHPAYKKYPVINISKQAAEMYCVWLAARLKTGYLKDADFEFEVRLPTKAEWQYAASEGFYSFLYPWGPQTLYDKKGMPRCTFNNMGAQNIYKNNATGEFEARYAAGQKSIHPMAPMASESYEANGFDLYDVCGNVAEMISDEDLALGGHWNSAGGDVQIKSEMPYDGAPSSFVGFRPVLVIKG